MTTQGDIVFMIGADVSGLTSAGNAGERSLADMEKAAKTLERQIGKIGEAGVAFQREMNQMTGVTREFSKSARDSAAAFEAFDKSRAQVDNLRASIDPLFAASKRYEAALKQLDAALEMGSLSAREHAQMVDLLSASYLRADGASGALVAGSGRMGGQMQQIGFQVQDFAVQVGAGTSATQAFAQQFPQLASAFGPVGVAVGTLAAVGLPLLVAAFGSTLFKADQLAIAMDELATSTQSAKDELFQLQNGLDTAEQVAMYRELGALVAEQTRLREEASISDGATAQALVNQADAMQSQIIAVRKKLEEDKKVRAEIAAIRAETDMATWATFNLQTGMAGAYAVYAQTRMMAAGIADETERAASAAAAFSAYQSELSNTGQSSGPDAARTKVQFGGGAFAAPVRGAGGAFVGSSGSGGGGGGGTDPRQARIEALVQSLRTEDEITAEWYAASLEALNAASEAELAAIGGKHSAIERLEQEHQARLSGIRDMGNQWSLQSALEGGAAILGAMSSTNKQAQKAQAVFSAASALMSTYQGAAKELQKGTFGFASAAAVIAKGLGFVAAIKSAGGGGGGGGGRGGGGSAAPAPAAQPSGQYLNFQFNGGWSSTEDMGRFMVKAINQAVENGSVIRGARIV